MGEDTLTKWARAGPRARSQSASVNLRGGHDLGEGTRDLVEEKGTIATLKHLEASVQRLFVACVVKCLIISQKLRRGDGPEGVSMPASCRNERLFGQSGRSSYRSNGIKLEKLGDDYEPRDDSCIKAFVRLLAQIAHAAVLAASETDSA